MTGEQLSARIIVRLKKGGFSAFLVGGCVRDMLLGRHPKDFDVATSATPAQILGLYPRAGLVGAHFGVVLVSEDGACVEVATYRSDGNYADGRRPESVTFETDARSDAIRRDFTINALLMDPETGEIVDYVDGRADLERGLIRAIGDAEQRFREDHLRLLRAVRFAARFGFEIEAATFQAIQKLAASVTKVAVERVRDEISRILIEGGAKQGFELLDATGLLPLVLPEISAMKGVEQPPEFHPEGDVWVHTLLMLGKMREPTVSLALGVLLHDVGKPATFRIAERIRFNGHAERGVEIARGILTRLRYPNDVMEQALALVGNHMKFIDVPKMRESTLKRFLRMPAFEEHMELHRLDCLASNGYTDSYEFVREKQRELPPEQLKPLPLLTGKDLIAAGYRPGPAFGAMLTAVEDAQLEVRIATKDEALEVAAQQFAAIVRGS